MTKVLIVGNGGREHALGWSILQDSSIERVFFSGGNAGTALEERCSNVRVDQKVGFSINQKNEVNLNEQYFSKLFDYVEKKGIDMVIVGPEQILVEGIADQFNMLGYKNIFGPTKSASLIESDKFYSYNLMKELNIPQAESISCRDQTSAEIAIRKISNKKGVVIKARGLTAGKGVYVCDSSDEALNKLKEHQQTYGYDVLIAERLFGEEFSVFGISDGTKVIPIEISIQDHKRLLDNDLGPNTGGMGAYGPCMIADNELIKKIADKMMTPIIKAMKEKGTEYKGFLYVAIIMTKTGPKILEYNCRLGDPETQALVMILKNGLYQPVKFALEQRLDEHDKKDTPKTEENNKNSPLVPIKPGYSCCVVLASQGYPGKYNTNVPIKGLETANKLPVKIFHAATTIKDNNGDNEDNNKDDEGKLNNAIFTSGGRVLGITAYSPASIDEAATYAYQAAEIISTETNLFNQKEVFFYRKDIAVKASILKNS